MALRIQKALRRGHGPAASIAYCPPFVAAPRIHQQALSESVSDVMEKHILRPSRRRARRKKKKTKPRNYVAPNGGSTNGPLAQCHYCQQSFPPDELTMDHVVPLIRGGRTTKSNVVPCCKPCNSQKQHLLPVEWAAYLERLRNEG